MNSRGTEEHIGQIEQPGLVLDVKYFRLEHGVQFGVDARVFQVMLLDEGEDSLEGKHARRSTWKHTNTMSELKN